MLWQSLLWVRNFCLCLSQDTVLFRILQNLVKITGLSFNITINVQLGTNRGDFMVQIPKNTEKIFHFLQSTFLFRNKTKKTFNHKGCTWLMLISVQKQIAPLLNTAIFKYSDFCYQRISTNITIDNLETHVSYSLQQNQ